MMAVWFMMIYYTLVPWLLGYALPVNNGIDISILTWTLVILSLISSGLWFIMQTCFLVVGNNMIKYQKNAIKNATFMKHINMRPLVSVVIPARNEEAVINRTILSGLTQTYQNVEIVVVCHNCNDNTYLVASQFNDKRVRAFDYKTEQAGKGLALDYGVERSRGDFILVLDSDGVLKEDFIDTALPLFDHNNIRQSKANCSLAIETIILSQSYLR